VSVYLLLTNVLKNKAQIITILLDFVIKKIIFAEN